MNINIILLFILIITSFMYPIFLKLALDEVKPVIVLIYRQTILSFLLLFYYFYKKINGQKIKLKKITKRYVLIATSLVLLLLISLPLYFYIMKINEISFFIPTYKVWSVLLPVLIGYILFNEKISKLQILGWIIMAIGLIIFYL